MAKRTIDEQSLFDAALKEFSRKSYEEASINKIIADAGIPKGSFYYRFANKYELYIYLLKESNRRKWQYINTEVAKESESDKNIFDFFMMQAEIGIRFAEAYPRYHLLSKMLSKEKESALYEQVMDDLGIEDESGISGMIEDSYKKGSFKTEFSLEFLDKLIKSLFYSFDDIFFKHEEFELDKAMKYLKDFVQFLRFGLKAVS